MLRSALDCPVSPPGSISTSTGHCSAQCHQFRLFLSFQMTSLLPLGLWAQDDDSFAAIKPRTISCGVLILQLMSKYSLIISPVELSSVKCTSCFLLRP